MGGRGPTLFAAIALLGCRGEVVAASDAAPEDGGATDGGATDSVVDAPACSPGAPFGVPIRIAELNRAAPSVDAALRVLDDTGIFASDRGSSGVAALFESRRSSGVFGAPTPLLEQAGTTLGYPSMTRDRLRLFALAVTTGDAGSTTAIVLARRASPDATFSGYKVLDLGASTLPKSSPFLSFDERKLYLTMVDDRRKLFESDYRQLTGGADELSVAVEGAFAKVNASAFEGASADYLGPVVSADGRTLYVARRALGAKSFKIVTATRADDTAQFEGLAEVKGLAPAGDNLIPSSLAPDGCTLYFTSAPSSTDSDLYLARKL